MTKLLLIGSFILFTLTCYAQTDKDHFEGISNNLFFPDYVFPVIQYKIMRGDTDSAPQDYELLNKFCFDCNQDSTGVYAIAIDSADTASNLYYSRILHAFKEPVLYNLDSTTEIHRLIWLRTFHHPIVIRLEKTERDCRIYWKVGNGMAGFEIMDRIIKKNSRKIGLSDYTTLITAFNKIGFWNRTNYIDMPESDGSTFLLEAASEANYNALIYSGDLSNTEFMNVCKMLIDYTGLKIKPKDFY